MTLLVCVCVFVCVCVYARACVQAAQQFRVADSAAIEAEVQMLKTFGKHPYLPLLHGLAKDHDGLLLAVLASSILHHSAICVLILLYVCPHTTICYYR